MVTSSAQAELVLADDADVDRYAEPTRILLIESDPRAAFVTARHDGVRQLVLSPTSGRRSGDPADVGAVVELGHALGLHVIAEGVETDALLA